MSVTISAVEWRIRRRLMQHAEQERWPVTPLLLGRIAKLASMAAQEPRPVDPPPVGGRKRRGRPSGAAGTASAPRV